MKSKSQLSSKTVWVSIAGILYAVGGYASGNLDMNAAITAAQVALSAWFIRLGID